jgi:hypothetical protein
MLISDQSARSPQGARVRALALAGLASAAVWLAPVLARAEDEGVRIQPSGHFWGETADTSGLPPAMAVNLNVAVPAEDETEIPYGTVAIEMPRAEFWGELPDPGEPNPPAGLARGGVNLLIAANKTGAQRYSDTTTSTGQKRRRSLASLVRSRLADDANFRNRTRFLARRIDESARTGNPPDLVFVQTGEEFLNALVSASRRGPIANLVIYGHAASTALFMREDRGFYASVIDVAKTSHVVSGEDDEKDEQLRLVGSRDMSDFEWLLSRGEIRFTRNPVIVFAGCGVAGKRDIERNSIASRMAELTGAKVIASIDVTDQSMARGRDFRNHEYSRRSWVRFLPGEAPERLNSKVIDALRHLNFGGEAVASASPANAN